MADNFTPITLNTQEEVNRFFGDRAEQAKRTAMAEAEKKYAGFDDFKAKAEKYDTDIDAKNQRISELEGERNTSAARITELETKIREYETNSVKMRIAREAGLPVELAERLSGENEDAIRADAEMLRKVFKTQGTAPLYKPNSDGANDNRDAALKDLLKKVRNQ